MAHLRSLNGSLELRLSLFHRPRKKQKSPGVVMPEPFFCLPDEQEI
jgi:hypothetical protein